MQDSFASIKLSPEFLASMEKALQHNKFASILFQADKLDAALSHYTKALEICTAIGLPYSNLYQNLGNLHAQKKEYEKARDYFLKVLEVSPYAQPSLYPDISKPKDEESGEGHQIVLYERRLNSVEAFVDAHTNLSFTLLGLGDPNTAVEYCRKSLKLKPNKEAYINFGNALRQVGRRHEAVKLVVEAVENDKRLAGDEKFKLEAIIVKNLQLEETKKTDEKLTFICVKWGTKYDAEYVNKLYRGVKRHTSKPFNFVCFTDHCSGLDQRIEARALLEDWKGWWGKASIFSSSHKIEGLKVFIDLDMIITGSLDLLVTYSGHFCLLRTDELYCEAQNKGGYNSSIVLWRSDCFDLIYSKLKECYSEVNQYIYRYEFVT